MLSVVILLGYAIGMVVLGIWLSRRVRTASEFYVAGRGLGAGLLSATLLAANLQYTHIAFAAGIAAIAFEETLSLREGIGLAVIAASGAWATWATRRAERTAHPPHEETPCRALPGSARTS